MSTVEVVVLQMSARAGDLAGNLDRFAELVLAHAGGADLVVAPELVTSGYDLDVLARRGRELAEPLDGPIAARVSELAKRVDATLVLGMLERHGAPHLAQDDLVAAGSIMAILPPLLLFAALNRFYVRGLFAGATKG